MHLNKTKKITTMAMLIAIVGASLILDKAFGFILADFCPVVIVSAIYSFSFKYGIRDCLILSLGIMIIGLLLGNIVSCVYFPAGILVGLLLCLVPPTIEDDKKNKLMLLFYFVAELIVSLLIYPLLNLGSVPVYEGNIIFIAYCYFSYIFTILIIAAVESFFTWQVCMAIKKRLKF